MIGTKRKMQGRELGSNQKHCLVLLSLRCLMDSQGKRAFRQLDIKSVGCIGLGFESKRSGLTIQGCKFLS